MTVSKAPQNRLIAAAKSGVSAAYGYDPMGRRVHKSGAGVSETFFLDSGDDEIAEYDGSGNLLRRYVPGLSIDRPVAMVDVSGSLTVLSFFHTDERGSVIAMGDASGNRVEGPYTYDAYGNGASASGVPYKYTGRRLDAETGLYYYRARMYSPALGRFLQTDPIGYGDQMNLYAYVGNDPTDRTDPSGKCSDMNGCGGAALRSQHDMKPFMDQITPKNFGGGVAFDAQAVGGESAGETTSASGAVDVSLSGMAFKDSKSGTSSIAVTVTHAAASEGMKPSGASSQSAVSGGQRPMIEGGGAQVTGGITLTTARTPAEFSGPGTTTSIGAGPVAAQVTRSDNGVITGTVSIGPGGGLPSITTMRTQTDIIYQQTVKTPDEAQ